MENNGGFHRLPLCSHVLQQCLRSLCTDSQWLYAVFWRILPRNFPPPKWEIGGYHDRTKANKRNWILVWEDGFCDFARATASIGLQPDLFFKMSHEIYNYGEGLMGKVSAENVHKWVHKDPSQTDNTPSWQNTIDPQPRTWEPQFKSGIQTIVVISVREGLVQLGSTQKIQEDLNFVTLLQRRFNSLLVTLSSSSPHSPLAGFVRGNKLDMAHHHESGINAQRNLERQMSWNGSVVINPTCQASSKNITNHHMSSYETITPSMSSLQTLLSKLPSVTSPPAGTQLNNNSTKTDTSLSFPHHTSPLLRSLSASHADFWLQEPSHSSPTSPSGNNVLPHPPTLDPHLRQHHSSLSPAFGTLDSNALHSTSVNAGDYTFMGDLMGG